MRFTLKLLYMLIMGWLQVCALTPISKVVKQTLRIWIMAQEKESMAEAMQWFLKVLFSGGAWIFCSCIMTETDFNRA